MQHSGDLLFGLFVMFGGGKLLAELFERLKQPSVVGEILAGVLLGPSLFSLIRPTSAINGIAEIGAIFLLFTVGLETKPSQLLRVGGTAALVAVVGVVFPFAFGFVFVQWMNHKIVESFFVGAAMVATSVGITARVLADLRVLQTRVAQVILGAAVLDDILGMLVLAVVSSLSAGHINYWQLAAVTAEAVTFALLMVFLGPRLVGQLRPAVARLQTANSPFVLSVVLCLGLSLASVRIGMAAIIGAFLAGLALAEEGEHWGLQRSAHPVMEFLAPFFFVLLGAEVNLRVLANSKVVVMALVISVLAIIGKWVGCGLGALGLGPKDAVRIGLGMVPRGEVGLIVAVVGLHLHTISDAIYAVVVIMSIVTTLFAPPLLRLVLETPQARETAETE